MTKFLQDLLFKGTVTLSTFVGSGTRMVVAGADGKLSTQTIPTSSITGSGTANYAARWLTATTLGDSAIYDNGSIVAIGTASPNAQSRLTLMGSSTYSKSIVLDSTWNYQTSFAMKNGIYSTEFNLGGSTKSTNEGGPGSLQVSTYNSSTGQYRYPITFFANSNVSFGGTGSSVPADNGSTVQVNGSLYVSTLAGTGTRMVVASATGVLSTQEIPSGGSGAEADTLDSVTDRGAITTNAISVGGVTATGVTLTSNGNLTTTNQFYGLVTNYTDGIFAGYDSSAVFLGYKLGSTPIHLGTQGTGNVLIRTSGNTIIENGKLFVGTSTDAGYKFDVNGQSRFSDHVVINTDAALFSGSAYNGYKMLGIGGATGGGISFVSNNGIAAEIFGDNGLTGLYLASYGAVPVITFYVNTTEAGRFTTTGEFQVNNLAGTGSRMVVADAAGKLSVQAIPTLSLTDTLDSVTDRGATTSNAISVGGLTTSGITLSTGTAYNLTITSPSSGRHVITGAYGTEYIDFGEFGNSLSLGANVIYFNTGGNVFAGNATISSRGVEGLKFNATNFYQQGDTRTGFQFIGDYTAAIAGGTSNLDLVKFNTNIATSQGTINASIIALTPTINTVGGTTNWNAIYYNPTVTGSTGLDHYFLNATAGKVKLGDLAGTGTRMVVADSTGQLSVQTVPTFSLTDTLDSVTDRGATTTNAITVGAATVNGVVSITTPNGGAIEFYPEGGSNATYSWMRAKLGSGLAPTLAWYGDVGGSYRAYGIYGPDSTYDGLLIYREAPTLADVILMGATKIALPSTQKIIWSSSTNVVDTPDLGLAREAAGLLQINNSSLNTYASLKLLNLTATGLAGSGTRMVTVDANGLLGSQAIPTGGTGSSTLSGLTDVAITSVANNQLLKYDSGTGKWINWTPDYLTSYTETYLGTVTSVAALTIGTSGTDITSTVATSTTTPVITLNIPDASVTARGVVTTGTQSFVGLKTFRGTTASDGPTLGSELTSTGSGTNWAGTGFATGYTHTSGSTAVLTTGLAAVSGNFYRIVLTITGRTAGFVQLDFGGYSNFVLGSFSISTRTSSTAALTLTPTTDFNGTVVLSIKPIVSYSAIRTFQNSSGTNILEYRGTADSIYYGLNAGKNASSVATNNVILGNNSGVGITDGTDIIAIGNNAATITAEVSNIIAIGSSALQNTRGVNNIAIGRNVLSSGGVSAGNVSIGNFTSTASANIYYTVAIGQSAGYSNTGNSNTIIGYDALYHKAAGDGNTIIGYQAGKYLSGFTANTSMSNSILIGYETRPSAISQTNQIIIGYNVIGQGSNTTSIGNSSTTLTYLYGSVQQTAVTSSMIKVDSVGKIVAAVAGTDYLTSVSVSNINATGTPSSTTYLRGDGTWSTISAGAGGTVTSVSVVSANGFAGTVATDTSTPAITLTTTVTGILKGNGTAISAAVAGTDYLTSSDLSGYLTSATAASTYQPLDGDLTAIAALSGTSGFLKKTAANTWSLDTNTYLTSYTETDPIWTSEKVNYYTKTEADARYLQSYTEIYQGTVTSVAALTLGTTGTDLSSSVATGTTTPVITLNVPTASASNRGALSSTDWSTFNSKQAGSTNLTSLSGLTFASTSFVKMTAAGTFALDTNTYYLASNPNGYTTNTGTVTTVSVVSANGLAGTVATAGTTPAITLSTTITGLLKGNGTAISAATANTDYLAVSNPVYTGILSTGTLTYTPANLFLSAQRSQNSFIQAVFQNTNTGATASADVVVNNNLSTDTTYYGDFGINGSGFTGTGSLTLANAVYLTATTGDLVLGTTTSNAVHIVVNSGATDAVTIKTTGQFQLPGYTSTSSFTGTAAGYLAFDSSGNILSVAAPSGGGGYTVTTQTTTYSVTATSGTVIVKGDTTGGTFTVTLPTAVGNTATIIVKKTAGSAALVIDGSGTETIDGGLNASLNRVNESVTLISDNANWQIV